MRVLQASGVALGAAIIVFSLGSLSGQSSRGTVTGQIRLSDGKPAAGVRVAAMEAPAEGAVSGVAGGTLALFGIVQSDADGNYRLEDIPFGRYFIVAGNMSTPTYYPNASSASQASVLTISNTRAVNNIDFVVLPRTVGFSVKGVVTRKGNAPGPQGIAMTGVGASGAVVIGPVEGVIGPDGAFEFKRVLPGTYLLSLAPSLGAATRTIVVEDSDITGIEMIVPRQITLTIRMSVQDDGPLPRFSLKFRPRAARSGVLPAFESTSPMFASMPDGTLQTVVPEGEYSVTVERLPFGFTVDSARYGSTNLLGSSVTIGPDSPGEVSIRFAPAEGGWGVIRGRIRGMENLPSDARRVVMLQGDALLQRLEAVIGPDGSFEFPKVGTGSYTATLDTGVFGVFSVPVSGKFGDTSYVELRAPVPLRVAGKVTVDDNNAAPLNFGFVLSHDSQEIRVPIAVQPDGQFSVVLPEGESRIAIVGLKPELYPTAFTYGSTNLFQDGLDLKGTNATAPPIQIALGRVNAAKRFKVSGRVIVATTGIAGLMFGAGSVELLGAMPDRPLNASVADGAFEFPAVLPGSYTLMVQPGVSGNFFQSSRNILPAPFPIVVTDKDVDNLEIIVGGATLSGQVSVNSGSQIPRFFFRLNVTRGTGQPLNPLLGQASSNVSPNVLLDGAFSLTLPLGRHFIEIDGFPNTYVVKEFSCGNTDLLNSPVTVGSSGTCQLRIVFATKRNTLTARVN